MRASAPSVPGASWGRPSIRALALVAFLVLSALFWEDSLKRVQHRKIDNSDQKHWLVMAASLNRHHTLSRSAEPASGVFRPTAYREPLYPALLAAQFALIPGMRDLEVADVVRGERGSRALVPAQYLQILGLYLTGVGVVAIVWKLTGSVLAAVLAGGFVWFSPVMLLEIRFYRNEWLAALLLTAASLALLVALRTQRARAFAAASAASGLLALTKALFAYFWLPVVVATGYLAWRQRWRLRPTAIGLAAFGLAFVVVVGPWMVRNYVHFERAFLTERGGVVLYLRALYAGLEPDEFRAAMVRYSKHPISWDWLQPQLEASSFARISRKNSEGFYQTAQRRRRALIRGLDRDRALADATMTEEAVSRIRARPLQHLLASIPLGIRGIYVERDIRWLLPRFPTLGIVSPILFASFLLLAARAALRTDAALIGALLPAFYAWAFHTLLTHNIARYNVICVPLLYASAVVVGVGLVRRLTRVVLGARQRPA